MSSKRFYTIPFVWSKTVWVMTFAIFGLWIGGSAFLLYKFFVEGDGTAPLVELVVLNAVMLPTILLSEGYAPQRLEVGEDRIVILRRYKSVVILREEVKSVERLPDNALRFALRTGGVGGLFGYFGSYHSGSIGAFSLYATSKKNLFLIRKWSGENVVISCAEPDKMDIFL